MTANSEPPATSTNAGADDKPTRFRGFKPVRRWIRSYGRTWLGRLLRLELHYLRHLKPTLSKQLAPTKPRRHRRDSSPRILVPLIETSHYQFYQVLALAKALEARGAQTRVLLCGSRLNGCEIKSVRGPKTDPCLTCRFTHTRIVPLFGLEVVELSDYISEDTVRSLRAKAEYLSNNYPREFFHEGIDIIPMTTDSVIRYYYGAIPDESTRALQLVRSQHLETSMIGIEVARSIFRAWPPDCLLANMNVYSAWEPYFRFFALHGIKTNLISLSPLDYSGVVLNRMDLYTSNVRFTKWRQTRNQSV